MKQELEETYQNTEPESIKNTVNENDSPCPYSNFFSSVVNLYL